MANVRIDSIGIGEDLRLLLRFCHGASSFSEQASLFRRVNGTRSWATVYFAQLLEQRQQWLQNW